MFKKQQAVIKWYEEFYAKQAEKNGHGKRWITNRVNKEIAKQESISNAEDVAEIEISVEWKKSRTWGMNPTATVKVFTYGNSEIYIGTASGCGYDKESASVASAMNEAPELLKMLYKAMETKADTKPYGVNDYENGISFAGGVGMSCYRNIAEWLSVEWSEVHGNSFDHYTMKF
jgi:hypothetical protein